MRSLPLLAAVVFAATAGPADARLFWQTYGATVATDSGCAWNINQDYFVPRHCDSGRYGLHSACKAHHTISAACKHLHPIYEGYCTPFSACRYHWRDHVYQARCGCTPLKCDRGGWHLDRCCKHGADRPHSAHLSGGCPVDSDAWISVAGADAGPEYGTPCRGDWLSDLEPRGGVILGSVAALPGGSAAASVAAQPGGPAPPSMPGGIVPTLGVAPSSSPPTKGVLPPVSSF